MLAHLRPFTSIRRYAGVAHVVARGWVTATCTRRREMLTRFKEHGSNRGKKCKESSHPVPCGDGSCQTDYISCLKVMSALEVAEQHAKSIGAASDTDNNGRAAKRYVHTCILADPSLEAVVNQEFTPGHSYTWTGHSSGAGHPHARHMPHHARLHSCCMRDLMIMIHRRKQTLAMVQSKMFTFGSEETDSDNDDGDD